MDNLISIIVPVYIVEKVLHYCIDSILMQRYFLFEFILIDDGSFDCSGKLCDEYAEIDNRIIVIHKKNAGVSSARNIGIDYARGKYVSFIDSDDYISKDYLFQLMTVKSKYPNIDNIWCGFQIVDGYEKPNILSKVNYSETEEISFLNKKQIMDLHDKGLDAGPVCKLYLLSVIIDKGLRFDVNLSLGEDLKFNFEYLNEVDERICVLNKDLYFYVQSNKESLCTRFHERLFEKYQLIHHVMRQCMLNWGCDDNQMIQLNNNCFYIYDFVLLNTYHKKSTIRYKLKHNKKIMQSREFQTTYNNTNCFIHPVYRFVYQHSFSAGYRLLMLYGKK